jgi:hypothetical protein
MRTFIAAFVAGPGRLGSIHSSGVCEAGQEDAALAHLKENLSWVQCARGTRHLRRVLANAGRGHANALQRLP